jgi:hypothetical protein
MAAILHRHWSFLIPIPMNKRTNLRTVRMVIQRDAPTRPYHVKANRSGPSFTKLRPPLGIKAKGITPDHIVAMCPLVLTISCSVAVLLAAVLEALGYGRTSFALDLLKECAACSSFTILAARRSLTKSFRFTKK